MVQTGSIGELKIFGACLISFLTKIETRYTGICTHVIFLPILLYILCCVCGIEIRRDLSSTVPAKCSANVFLVSIMMARALSEFSTKTICSMDREAQFSVGSDNLAGHLVTKIILCCARVLLSCWIYLSSTPSW